MSMMAKMSGKPVAYFGRPIVCEVCLTQLRYADRSFSHEFGTQVDHDYECPECGQVESGCYDPREDFRTEEPDEYAA